MGMKICCSFTSIVIIFRDKQLLFYKYGLLWTEDAPEVTQSAQQSPYSTGKNYGKSNKKQSPYSTGKDNGKSNTKSGKASTSFHTQRRTDKSATTKQPGRSIMYGLSDTSDESDSEFVGAPTPTSSRSHILNPHRKSFQNGTALATPPSNGRTERERNKTASQPVVILFSL